MVLNGHLWKNLVAVVPSLAAIAFVWLLLLSEPHHFPNGT
jgi:hypothetical protein